MRTMSLEFPDDPNAVGLEQQYMFGDQLLVAPVAVQGATSKDVYVPVGEWYDLWNSAQFSGPRTKTYGVPLNLIPVYARPGAIIPLNLNTNYELGGAIGNATGPYPNLTFRVYPSGQSSYQYYDDAADVVATIQVNELWTSHQVAIVVPKLSTPLNLQVVAGLPSGVTVDGATLPGFPTLTDLNAAPSGWYWNPILQATLIKLPASQNPRRVELNGVDKAAYEAEFAVGVGTTVNTNHANFTGLGFVDGFDQVGDSVTFSVNADVAAQYSLRFRYANTGGTTATRNIYLDDLLLGTLILPPLVSWDSWGIASLTAFLSAGPHNVQIRYDQSNAVPINLDSLSLVWNAPASVSVLTQHNDVSRTGANLAERVLTAANVTPATFGKLFSYPVQGQVFAQPLYLSGVNMPGKGIRNILYVATMHNRVYAFDADNPSMATSPLWQRKLEPPIPLPDANIGTTYIDPQTHRDTGQPVKPTGEVVYRDIVREVGILSTPVISPQHNALYVVTASKDPARNDLGAYTHHLRALDLATGQDKFGGPVEIQANFRGDGYVGRYGETDAVANTQISFVSHRQLQRAGLVLANDTIYIAFASYGDKDCYHGWVLAYNASTLKQTSVFNTSPSRLQVRNPRDVGRGGIWQAGQGPAADGQAVYVLTGNGGYADGTDFGDCFIKLRLSDLAVLDWFSPFNQQQLAEHDLDVGSAGLLLIPGTDLLIGGGKESKFFLMKRDQMGHYDQAAGNSQIMQNFYIHAPENPADPIVSAAKDDGTGHHVHGGPVYWDGPSGKWIYIWVEEDVIKAFQLLPNGTFQTIPLNLTGIPNAQLGVTASQGALKGLGGVSGKSPGMPGGMLSLSANGNTAGSGVLWATHPLANANQGVVPGILRAFDATDLGKELWNSKVNPTRDDVGNYAKFSPPTVANGRVYVVTFSNQVIVYGLR